MTRTTTLLDALSSAKVFGDGDWVESKDQDAEGDVRLIQLADVGDGYYVNKSNRFLTSAAAKRLKCTFLEPGDVLIARMPDPLGRACIFPGDMKRAVTVVDVCIIRVDPAKMYAPWLVHCINSSINRNQIAGYITGTTRQRISRGNLGKIEITLPPLSEQRRIAAILDKADALRAKRRESLAQLDSLTQSIFIEMFGDPGNNPKEWPVHALKDLIAGKANNGIFKKNDEYGTGLPVVWVEELFRGNGIDCSNSRRLAASARDVEQYGLNYGDVLFCRSSLKLSGIGYNNVYLGEDKKALFECHVIRISPDKKKIDPVFFNFALRMPNQRQKLLRHAKTVTMSTIDQDGLLRLDLPVPPLNLQMKFADVLNATERLKAVHLQQLKALDNLFSSLQHRAFRGEL